MTKLEKLQHLGEAVKWLEKAVPPLAMENTLIAMEDAERVKIFQSINRYLYNAIRRIGAVVEELVKEQSDSKGV